MTKAVLFRRSEWRHCFVIGPLRFPLQAGCQSCASFPAGLAPKPDRHRLAGRATLNQAFRLSGSITNSGPKIVVRPYVHEAVDIPKRRVIRHISAKRKGCNAVRRYTSKTGAAFILRYSFAVLESRGYAHMQPWLNCGVFEGFPGGSWQDEHVSEVGKMKSSDRQLGSLSITSWAYSQPFCCCLYC